MNTRDQVLKALAELVACKDLKERAHKINPQVRYNLGRYRRMLLDEYDQRKGPAWAAAREALETVRREVEVL
jgi:hypothetical protein